MTEHFERVAVGHRRLAGLEEFDDLDHERPVVGSLAGLRVFTTDTSRPR